MKGLSVGFGSMQSIPSSTARKGAPLERWTSLPDLPKAEAPVEARGRLVLVELGNQPLPVSPPRQQPARPMPLADTQRACLETIRAHSQQSPDAPVTLRDGLPALAGADDAGHLLRSQHQRTSHDAQRIADLLRHWGYEPVTGAVQTAGQVAASLSRVRGGRDQGPLPTAVCREAADAILTDMHRLAPPEEALLQVARDVPRSSFYLDGVRIHEAGPIEQAIRPLPPLMQHFVQKSAHQGILAASEGFISERLHPDRALLFGSGGPMTAERQPDLQFRLCIGTAPRQPVTLSVAHRRPVARAVPLPTPPDDLPEGRVLSGASAWEVRLTARCQQVGKAVEVSVEGDHRFQLVYPPEAVASLAPLVLPGPIPPPRLLACLRAYQTCQQTAVAANDSDSARRNHASETVAGLAVHLADDLADVAARLATTLDSLQHLLLPTAGYPTPATLSPLQRARIIALVAYASPLETTAALHAAALAAAGHPPAVLHPCPSLLSATPLVRDALVASGLPLDPADWPVRGVVFAPMALPSPLRLACEATPRARRLLQAFKVAVTTLQTTSAGPTPHALAMDLLTTPPGDPATRLQALMALTLQAESHAGIITALPAELMRFAFAELHAWALDVRQRCSNDADAAALEADRCSLDMLRNALMPADATTPWLIESLPGHAHWQHARDQLCQLLCVLLYRNPEEEGLAQLDTLPHRRDRIRRLARTAQGQAWTVLAELLPRERFRRWNTIDVKRPVAPAYRHGSARDHLETVLECVSTLGVAPWREARPGLPTPEHSFVDTLSQAGRAPEPL